MSQRGVARLAAWVVVVGVVAAVWGVVVCAYGMTRTGSTVTAPVHVSSDDGSGLGRPEVHLDGVTVPEAWLAPGGGRAGVAAGSDGTLTIVADESTWYEQLLSRGDTLVYGIGLLVGALMLAPVLRWIGRGRAFAPGNARRISAVAATIAVAGTLAPILPDVAGQLVLRRLAVPAGNGDAFAFGLTIELVPTLVAVLVLAVAAAFSAGEQLERQAKAMADELAGLV
ncbi:hypothetical protein IC607_04100 [Cellulomonas sp. JH27-2]|uniref:hypothetical protein n=1 Tax=Cellulomonas sp. JH27-2 TaxID=2774139 RepID=UPI0017843142|nr:hypothetical protein [Cellulomonas sp. JH27-2]MBD8058149.1 hypothetical protein [Cellulomonas sp. JH27-2]